MFSFSSIPDGESSILPTFHEKPALISDHGRLRVTEATESEATDDGGWELLYLSGAYCVAGIMLGAGKRMVNKTDLETGCFHGAQNLISGTDIKPIKK